MHVSFPVPADESLPADVSGELASIVLPGSGTVVARMFRAVHDERTTNRSLALQAAERTAGMSREDLAERIEARPALVPLVTRLLWEATMTGQGPLLEAMGAAFGAAVDDPVHCQEYELVLGGLRDLRGDDVRVLRQLREADIFFQQTGCSLTRGEVGGIGATWVLRSVECEEVRSSSG